MDRRRGGRSRTGGGRSISESIRDGGASRPFSSQPCGLRAFWPAALSLIGKRPPRVFSLFASRIHSKSAAAPLHQSLTWCTSTGNKRTFNERTCDDPPLLATFPTSVPCRSGMATRAALTLPRESEIHEKSFRCPRSINFVSDAPQSVRFLASRRCVRLKVDDSHHRRHAVCV